MGWRDAPVVDSPAPTQPAWMSAPVVDMPSSQPASLADKMVGGWGGRTALGMASPLIAGAQLLGGEGTRAKLAELEAMKQRGMAAEGKEGFDWYGLLGSMAPGAGITKGVSAALPKAGPIVQGLASGGATAAAMPSSGVTADEYFPQKAAQVGWGTAVGGVIPAGDKLATNIGKFGRRVIEPFSEAGRADILSRYQQKLVGEAQGAREKLAAALQAAREHVAGSKPTSGQVLAELPKGEGTGLISHERAVGKMEGISPEFTARKAEQEAARRSALVPIARNEGALEGEKAIRDTVTGPMRERALGAANETGRVAAAAEAQLAEKQRMIEQAVRDRMKALPTPEMPVKGDALRTAQELHAPGPAPVPLKSAKELAVLQQTGERLPTHLDEAAALKETLKNLAPLKANQIVQRITGLGSQPGIRANTVAADSLGTIKEKIAGLANEKGVVEANDLYMVRKEAAKIVKKYAEEHKDFDQKMTAGLVAKVEGYIDDAIEKAGGTGWRAYLAKYQELSKPINRMEAGQELEKALTSSLGTVERGPVFGNVLRAKPELVEALTDADQRTIKGITTDLARSDAAKRLAQQTTFGGAQAIHEGVQLPNLLSREAMLANYLMKVFGKEPAHQKIAQLAASQYLNPPKLAESLLRQPIPPRYQQMIDALMQQAPAAAAAGTARNF